LKERCVIGCGCGKNKKNRSKRIELARKKIVAAKKLQKIKSTKILANSPPLAQKTAICMSCNQSRQTVNERKRGLRVCHQSNRLISNITKDNRFKCPIGKWDGIK